MYTRCALQQTTRMEEKESSPLWEAPTYDCVDESVGEPYCFESDHVALRTNPDYHKLLRTICVLEAQRAKAIEDIELLYQAQEKVLKDPITYVDRLQRTGNLGIPLPGRQQIAELPVIDWRKYTSSVDFKSFGSHRQSARLKQHGKEAAEDENLQRLKSSLAGGAASGEGTVTEGFVRGRFKDESKSATFNKLWTPEEQKRLDDLLIQFPPEEVEARRWRKIAAAFGDRTPQQIASRVQKYFQKLEKNRLPVPGRVPNCVAARVKRSGQRALYQRPSWMYTESTFLQKYKAPVMMREDEDDEMSAVFSEPSLTPISAGERDYGEDRTGEHDDSEEEAAPEELQHMAEYQELKQLKKLREEKLKALDPSVPVHHGFKCDRCGCAPIVGARWHCVDCPSGVSLDFCETCSDNMGTFETRCHNSSHRLRPVKRMWTKATQDQDYMNFNGSSSSSSYNYLDPNYMPAV